MQQGLRHLQTAFTNFFGQRAGYPTFKKKRNGGSAEFTRSAFRYKGGQVHLAKCSQPLPIRWSRQLPDGREPSTITVQLQPSGRWYVSIRFDDNRDLSLKPIDKAVGIDVGVNSLITTSDGFKVSNPKSFDKNYKRLRKAQKSLSRKQKGSNNRTKARLKVAKIHAQITDSRLNHLHKLTTQLVRDNQTIAVEDLAIKNMVKNPKLARSISDAAWGEFVSLLDYKSQWYGRTLIKIDRWFPSSKMCSSCGHTLSKLPLNIREWNCPSCGVRHDRDINASLNILAVGHTVSVCGANIRPNRQKSGRQLRNPRQGQKQKPKS